MPIEITGEHAADKAVIGGIGDGDGLIIACKLDPVSNYRDVFKADAARNAAFNKSLRAAGLLKSAGKLYPSLAIDQDLEWTDLAIRQAAADIR
ncbi:hypothetical protein PZ897_10775 [Hoeflea sp. YIM 152468]|uniref:hypothetical protein n=1 Tax=Hoeflea sp. YIM 152468 TaxID=3031759 RepID=UPI0023DB2F46|nr:hypothetical protein [Hoeflea sp. YIM 152468]MDF1608660.1 hypothetical protein [Hoeflea sp. YIM 152468]